MCHPAPSDPWERKRLRRQRIQIPVPEMRAVPRYGDGRKCVRVLYRDGQRSLNGSNDPSVQIGLCALGEQLATFAVELPRSMIEDLLVRVSTYNCMKDWMYVMLSLSTVFHLASATTNNGTRWDDPGSPAARSGPGPRIDLRVLSA